MGTPTKIEFASGNITVTLSRLTEYDGLTEYEAWVTFADAKTDNYSIQTVSGGDAASAAAAAMRKAAWSDMEEYFYNSNEPILRLAREFAAMETVEVFGDSYYISDGDILDLSAKGYLGDLADAIERHAKWVLENGATEWGVPEAEAHEIANEMRSICSPREWRDEWGDLVA